MINLSQSVSKTLDHAKIKALMSLKGKSIEKVNPNHVPARKRKAEVLEKSKEKISKVLREDNYESTLNK